VNLVNKLFIPTKLKKKKTIYQILFLCYATF